YHFGEQHLEDKISGSKVLKSILYTAYGMLIFSLIFIENLKDVEVVMRNLTGKIIPNSWIETMLVTSSLLLITLITYLFTRKIKPNIQIVREFFYILLLYLVFKTSSLIFGFAIYFVLWHSIPSILDQTKFLSGGYTFKTMLEYLKTAFVYWLISITGLVVAYYYLSESLFNSIIFIVLFAVTAPHVWVMNRMKQ
ncbi:MAG: beta-carotene 15,15'-dioxygenase, Brp/Blh family, partial [Flavobacterium sp.]|nr:beta-carotene 15,15'-dioxygenase, Brp/Blh family [Flavobacterium sp.]